VTRAQVARLCMASAWAQVSYFKAVLRYIASPTPRRLMSRRLAYDTLCKRVSLSNRAIEEMKRER